MKICRIYWQWILIEQTSLYTVVYRTFLYNPTNLKVPKKHRAQCWSSRWKCTCAADVLKWQKSLIAYQIFRHQIVWATAEGEGRHSRWGLWNTGISPRLPLLQLLLSMFSRRDWRKSGQKSFPISPIDWNLISPIRYPHPTCTSPVNSYNLYMLPNSLLYICGFFRPVVSSFLPL